MTRTWEKLIEVQIKWLMSIGTVWLYAWLINPNITSSTVWFVAVLWATIIVDVGERS